MAAPAPESRTAPRWQALTDRALRGLETCDPAYRPTSFWTPGVKRLLDDMDRLGLEEFKTWPTAFFWFYPTYGPRLSGAGPDRVVAMLRRRGVDFNERRLREALRGLPEAMRDFDAARLAWNQDAWPADLEGYGESDVGSPVQRLRLTARHDVAFTKPYLNYLLCMAALSQHISAAPRSVLEIGGGFGVLGELLMSRDADVRYVNLDIPPLLTVSSYYLTTLFGDERVMTFDEQLPPTGPLDVPRSACLPNWRIDDLVGPFDVFVNSYSFQEMEPPAVEHYIDRIAALEVGYVVSLNSLRGKEIATREGEVGVREQVVSASIISMFEARGYELCGRYHRPLITGAGELAILRRR
jgi:putative sugar O-methyltransferase